MADERLRVPLDDVYATALGRAAFIFARLEWQVVWCAEKLKPGFVTKIGTKTAGQIGAEFEHIVTAISDPALQVVMLPLAQEFRTLVQERNALLHGKPGTVSTTGEQRLFHHGAPWHIEKIDAASDRFAVCGSALNSIFYGSLQTYVP